MNTNIQLDPNIAAIFGALVADSASLSLHWLYDPLRITQIEKTEGLVFLQPNANHYADTKGYFVHGKKQIGDSSGYGELCLLMLKHLAQNGKFDRETYQTEYCAHFGPGGSFVGFIDTATRLTLRTLLPLKPSEYPEISGADDDQFAALATIPVVVATHQGTQDNLLKKIERIVRLTNHNDIAVSAAQYAATVLIEVINGRSITKALNNALPLAGKELKPLLEIALSVESFDSIAMAKRFGSACHVLEGLPIVVHIAQHAKDYRSAVEANIRASGDSCGRSIMLGAIMAAHTTQQNGMAWHVLSHWNGFPNIVN